MARVQSLFERLLGASFASLPPAIQGVHDSRAHKRLHGYCSVSRGSNAAVAVLAPLVNLPPTSAQTKITVDIVADAQGETWSRNFGGHVMRSRLWQEDDFLAERLGSATLLFRLQALEGAIHWRVAGLRVFGIRIPASIAAKATASEQVINEHYHFDVSAVLLLVGSLVHYRGTLTEHE